MSASIRAQIKAAIVECIADAQAQGFDDGVGAARRAFPGTPEAVLYECWWALEDHQVEAWWRSLERTIDGEVIRNALQKQEGKR